MLFVALLKARPGTEQDRITRRITWQMPEVGVDAIGEYWLQTPDPSVVTIFTADNMSQIWAVFAGWNDFFEISIYPAIHAKEGLELLKQMPLQ